MLTFKLSDAEAKAFADAVKSFVEKDAVVTYPAEQPIVNLGNGRFSMKTGVNRYIDEILPSTAPRILKEVHGFSDTVALKRDRFAEIIFKRNAEVLAHVAKHDGTVARAYDRAQCGQSPECAWLGQANVLAEELMACTG